MRAATLAVRGTRLYPRSFRRLLAVALLLVALPLVVALIGSALALRGLSEKSVQAVYQTSLATQASRQLAESMLAQERAARQYLVLGDEQLWNSYLEQRRLFAQQATQLARSQLNDVQQQRLAGLVNAEDDLYQRLAERHARGTGASDRRWQESLSLRFAGLTEISRQLLEENSLAVEREIDSLRQLADNAEHRLYYLLAALLPLILGLIFGFTRLLTAPVAQIEKAIAGLHAGHFERAIAVDGPHDLKLLGDELDRLRLRLVTLEEQKSRFLRHISHELKTPLTALREGSDLLAEGAVGELTPAQQEVVAILRDNSLRLRALIEDLLDYSAAEFEQSALRRQLFPLRELIECVIDSQRLAAQSRQLAIYVAMDDIALNADRERLRTVIDNLLSNAIKYSPEATTIDITARREGDDVVIEVADQGPGIADSDRPRVFEPFYRGRPPAAGSVKSSGLGLSIAREHVLAHGGSLQLLPGSGARFAIRLPVQ